MTPATIRAASGLALRARLAAIPDQRIHNRAELAALERETAAIAAELLTRQRLALASPFKRAGALAQVAA